MNQKELNQVRMDDWEREGKREHLFMLPLTAKHQLDVGKWVDGDEWGIDLRRRSYAEGRLLGRGLAVHSETWMIIASALRDIHGRGGFTDYGEWQESEYAREADIDDEFALSISRWDGGGTPFLSIGLLRAGNRVFGGRFAEKAALIKFATVSDFVAASERTGIMEPVPVGGNGEEPTEIDPRTGRPII